jgi:hypothetical protein
MPDKGLTGVWPKGPYTHCRETVAMRTPTCIGPRWCGTDGLGYGNVNRLQKGPLMNMNECLDWCMGLGEQLSFKNPLLQSRTNFDAKYHLILVSTGDGHTLGEPSRLTFTTKPIMMLIEWPQIAGQSAKLPNCSLKFT